MPARTREAGSVSVGQKSMAGSHQWDQGTVQTLKGADRNAVFKCVAVCGEEHVWSSNMGGWGGGVIVKHLFWLLTPRRGIADIEISDARDGNA